MSWAEARAEIRDAAGSYFAECPRDEKGRCLPSGSSPAAGEETDDDPFNPKDALYDGEAAKVAVEEQGKRLNTFTPDHLDAIEAYTDYGYKGLNDWLRSGQPPDSTCETIDDAIAKAGKLGTKPVVLYRGINFGPEHALEIKGDPQKFVAEKFPVGGIVKDGGYWSASLDEQTAKQFGQSAIFQIEADEGLYVDRDKPDELKRKGQQKTLTSTPGEQEVILPRTSAYKVKGVKMVDGRLVVSVSQVKEWAPQAASSDSPTALIKALPVVPQDRGTGKFTTLFADLKIIPPDEFNEDVGKKAESYFSICPRDSLGRCLPSGAAIAETHKELLSVAVPDVKIEKAPEFKGDPVEVDDDYGKQQTGRIAERVINRVFRGEPLNADNPSFAIDCKINGYAAEVKGGSIANGKSAQQWRITRNGFSLSAKEQAKYDKLSPAGKQKFNAKKQADCMLRKEKRLKEQAEKTGEKLRPVTVTAIVNKKTGKADLYAFPRYHMRIGWKSEQAKQGYIGTVNFRDLKVDES